MGFIERGGKAEKWYKRGELFVIGLEAIAVVATGLLGWAALHTATTGLLVADAALSPPLEGALFKPKKPK